MQGFWKLTSILISLMGFIITGVIMFLKGADLADMVFKAIMVFAALYAVQTFLGGILVSVANSRPTSAQPDENPRASGGA